jgi:hypothetical protein
MQEEQQKGMDQLQQHMEDEWLRKLQDSVTHELQQEREARRNEMQQLRSEQSTLKAQVIANITNTKMLDEQLQIKFNEQLQQQEKELLQEMEKLRGSDVTA